MISCQMDSLQACPALTLVSAFLALQGGKFNFMFHIGTRAGKFPETVRDQ